MVAFDPARALRRLKPHRFTSALARRADEDLPFIDEDVLAGPPLLLDACVYGDVMQGRTPPLIDELLTVRTVNHSTVCLAEVTHVLGRLDPAHPGTEAASAAFMSAIDRIPDHRLHMPNASDYGMAGIVAGTLFRTQGWNRGQEVRVLNDALIFLQARSQGWTVLTRNISDFDLLSQIIPDGRVLFYRV